MMRKAVVGITLFLLAAPLVADEKLEDRMMHSASILQEIRGPLEEEAPGVLENAHAVAVFPEFVKVGLFGGVKHGRGVLSTRLDSGSWSRPAFVRITSGSFGLQFGVSMSQLLIVFKDPKAVEAISGGQLTIGADAGYAAGELGGSATAGTDNKLENRIVMMARSKGLFAGVSLEGGVLRIEKDSNVEFYNDAIGLDGRTLLEDEQVELPPVAQHFLIVLDEAVPPVSPDAAPANHEGDGESDVDLRFAEDENAKTVADSAADYSASEDPGARAWRETASADSFVYSDNPPSQSIASTQRVERPGSASGGSWTTPDGRELPVIDPLVSSNPAPGAGNGLSANAAPEAASWVTPEHTIPGPHRGPSSGPGLTGRIAGRVANAALDHAKDLAVGSISNSPEAQGAKLAASVGGDLASSVWPDSSPPAPQKRPLPEPEAAIASTDGAWITPDEADYRIARRAPEGLPPASRALNTELTGPPAPSEWPAEWRDAQMLGGVCEPGL